MVGKLSFIVGFGAGYVLGARSGRERYEQIVSKAQQIWQDPRVQEKAGQAQQLAKDKGGAAASAVADKASETGSKVASSAKDKVQGKTQDTTTSDTSLGGSNGVGSVSGSVR